MTTIQMLAKAIVAMNYGDLKNIGGQLAEMIQDKEVRPKPETAEGFADLLFDWAEAQTEGE